MQPGSVARSARWSPSSAPCVCHTTISLTFSPLCARASSPSRAQCWPTHVKCTCVSQSLTTRPSSKRADVVLERLSSHRSPSASRSLLFLPIPCSAQRVATLHRSRCDAEDRYHARSARTAPGSHHAGHLRGPRNGCRTRPRSARSSRACWRGGQYAVFRTPRFGEGRTLLARVDCTRGIGEAHVSCHGVAGRSRGHATSLRSGPHTAGREARLGARPRQGCMGIYFWVRFTASYFVCFLCTDSP